MLQKVSFIAIFLVSAAAVAQEGEVQEPGHAAEAEDSAAVSDGAAEEPAADQPASDSETESAEPPARDAFMEAVGAEYDRFQGGVTAADGADAAPQNQAPSGVGFYLQWFLALLLVIAAILTLSYLARRFGKRTPLLAGSHLGKVLGRVYLDRNVQLHYIETAGRVLVVGVSGSGVSLVADFEASAFKEAAPAPDSDSTALVAAQPSFLEALRVSNNRMDRPARAGEFDEEIADLRKEVHRLQRYIREDVGELAE